MAKRVTEQEKEKMWQLYQKHGSYTKVAKLTKRDRSTVARYVSEYEASVRMVGVIKNTMVVPENIQFLFDYTIGVLGG